jgi:hypothetical protein
MRGFGLHQASDHRWRRDATVGANVTGYCNPDLGVTDEV